MLAFFVLSCLLNIYTTCLFIPYSGCPAVESQQAAGTPDQDTESEGGGGGRKEREGGQEPGPPTQVGQK